MTKQTSYKLIIAGNKNIHGLINCVIASTIRLRENHNDKNIFFKQVHIFHTEQSLQALISAPMDWKTEVASFKIPETTFIHHVNRIEDTNIQNFRDLVEQLKEIINPFDDISTYYIDLTSGVSTLKSILTVFAYVLNIENIYTLEIKFSENSEERSKQSSSFYQELLGNNVSINYKKFPPISEFDDFGKLNLTEVIRYKDVINQISNSVSLINNHTLNLEHLKTSLNSGINSRLFGDVNNNNNDFKNSIFSFSTAIEEIANSTLSTFSSLNFEDKTLGVKLAEIRNIAENNSSYFINLKILDSLTKLINSIRNETVHPNKSNISKEILKIQSNISYHISIAFIQFITKSILAFMDEKGDILKITTIEDDSIKENDILYFGFDGDRTGNFIEKAFDITSLNDAEVRSRSSTIKNTINELVKKIKKHKTINAEIIFAEGDNILFKGYLDKSFLIELQKYYSKNTELNCSIGFGKSLQSASIALKLAKTQKENSITGIELSI